MHQESTFLGLKADAEANGLAVLPAPGVAPRAPKGEVAEVESAAKPDDAKADADV